MLDTAANFAEEEPATASRTPPAPRGKELIVGHLRIFSSNAGVWLAVFQDDVRCFDAV